MTARVQVDVNHKSVASFVQTWHPACIGTRFQTGPPFGDRSRIVFVENDEIEVGSMPDFSTPGVRSTTTSVHVLLVADLTISWTQRCRWYEEVATGGHKGR